MGPPRRAERGYAAFEPVIVEPDPLWARVSGSSSHLRGGGMVEHRIDAAELRNEAAFINDFRDNVSDLGLSSRRSPNVTVTTCVIDGSVHAVVSTTEAVAEGRELLLDYGEDYWHGAQDQVAVTDQPPSELPAPEVGAPTGGAGARRRREAAMRKLEEHQPLDREAVYLVACAANDGFAGWEWLDRSKAFQQMRGLCLHEGVDSSPAALPERIYTEDTPIDFPGSVYQHTSTAQRREVLRAIQDWMQRGAQAELVYVGRLLNPAHPAAANSLFGLFAREDLPAGAVLCDYQGVRYTSAAGIDPFHPKRLNASIARGTVVSDSVPNQNYMLSLATVVSGGAGISSQMRVWSDECAPTSAEDARAAWLTLASNYEDTDETGDDEDADDEEILHAMEREALRREYWLAQLIAFAEAPPAAQSALYVAFAAFSRENRAARCDVFGTHGSQGHFIGQAERERAAYVWCVKRDALADVPPCVQDLDVEVAQAVLQLFDRRGVRSCRSSTAAAARTETGDSSDTDVLLAPEGLSHACDPNLLLLPPDLDSGSAAVFVATREIKQGEKLTVHSGGHCALPTPLPPAQTAIAAPRTTKAGCQTQCVCVQCRTEDRLRSVVCPVCVPPSERRSGYILPPMLISASVEEDQQQTGYVTPQWQQPVGRFRSTAHTYGAGASGQCSSSDEEEEDAHRREGPHHCAGWECNHFQEHFVPRRGGGGHEQKRWDHHRGVMQRRWLPTTEVDCCQPMPAVTGGARGAAGGMIRAPPVDSPLKGVLAVEVIALKLVWAMQTDLDRVAREITDMDAVEEIRAACCKRANAVASVVGRQHWLTNHALALLVSRCSVAESHGLFSLYCWITVWLGRSAATAAVHLLPLCNSDTAVSALVAILDAEAPAVRRGFADCGLLPADDGPTRAGNGGHGGGDCPGGDGERQTVSEVVGAPETASGGAAEPCAEPRAIAVPIVAEVHLGDYPSDALETNGA